jgi:hypothetical protein
MLFQNPTQFFLQWLMSYVFAPISLVIFVVFAVLKWRDSKHNKYNLVLLLFFVFLILGLVANVFYAILVNIAPPEIYLFAARVAAYLFAVSIIFPQIFLIALLRGFKDISRRYLVCLMVGWFLAFSPIFYLGTVYLDIDFVVRWDWVLAGTSLAIDGVQIAVMLYLSHHLWITFGDPLVKHRFLAFIIGYLIIGWTMISVILVKTAVLSSEVSSTSLGIGLLIAPALIFYGIGRQRKNE